MALEEQREDSRGHACTVTLGTLTTDRNVPRPLLVFSVEKTPMTKREVLVRSLLLMVLVVASLDTWQLCQSLSLWSLWLSRSWSFVVYFGGKVPKYTRMIVDTSFTLIDTRRCCTGTTLDASSRAQMTMVVLSFVEKWDGCVGGVFCCQDSPVDQTCGTFYKQRLW